MSENSGFDHEHLDEVRQRILLIRGNLPQTVDVRAIGTKSKSPYRLFCAREASIWRMEEVSRNALDALDRGDLAVAAILARCALETAALVWKLMDLLDGRASLSEKYIAEVSAQLSLASKKWGDAPDPINILTLIEKMEKRIQGVKSSYEVLSEISHPNYTGTLGLFSKTDYEAFVTQFGRNFPGSIHHYHQIGFSLLATLGVFELAYNRSGDLLREYITELEPL